jgi:hypothetical protein
MASAPVVCVDQPGSTTELRLALCCRGVVSIAVPPRSSRSQSASHGHESHTFESVGLPGQMRIRACCRNRLGVKFEARNPKQAQRRKFRKTRRKRDFSVMHLGDSHLFCASDLGNSPRVSNYPCRAARELRRFRPPRTPERPWRRFAQSFCLVKSRADFPLFVA